MGPHGSRRLRHFLKEVYQALVACFTLHLEVILLHKKWRTRGISPSQYPPCPSPSIEGTKILEACQLPDPKAQTSLAGPQPSINILYKFIKENSLKNLITYQHCLCLYIQTRSDVSRVALMPQKSYPYWPHQY